MNFWMIDNPRPDTVKAYIIPRVCLLSFLGGSGHWIWFGAISGLMLGDYSIWWQRRRERRTP